MRKSTLLWLMLTVFCGVTLFHTSQRVYDAREEIATLNRSIGKEEESIRVLQTEWGGLNRPDQLERLAKKYLKLTPMKGNQFIRLEEISLRVQKPEAGSLKLEKKVITVASSPPVVVLPNKNPVNHFKNNVRLFRDVIKGLGVE
ncbi:MAG: hypothetical protein KAI76_02045 [Alphaproteobacteria bacterium]|nr:hypothetical protein [Alphaproteobacteria bacterium]MCK5658629.1 hypothetical protein [Alphaproteobacteria bacterium]